MKNVRLLGTTALIVLLPVTALSACAPPSPEVVAGKFVDAMNSHDVDGGLALFADDSVLEFPGQGPYTGKADVRRGLESLAADGLAIRVESTSTEDGTVTQSAAISTDSWKAMGISNLGATSRMQVEGGRVQRLQISLTEASARALQAAIWKSAEAT